MNYAYLFLGFALGSIIPWILMIAMIRKKNEDTEEIRKRQSIPNDLLRERNKKTMPIRMQIATSALNGYLSGREHPTREMTLGDNHHSNVATACLRYADAMIAASKEGA